MMTYGWSMFWIIGHFSSFVILLYFSKFIYWYKHILEWESIRGQSNHLASIFAKDAHTETWVITQNTMLAVFYHGKIDKGWLNVLAEFFFFKNEAEQIPYTFLSPHWIDIAVFPWLEDTLFSKWVQHAWGIA